MGITTDEERYMELMRKYTAGTATEDEIREWVNLMNKLEDGPHWPGRVMVKTITVEDK